MRRFIVATHAYMSKGIVSSLELIMVPQENLKYFCAYVEENKPYQIELLKELDSYDPEDEIVIFTDLFPTRTIPPILIGRFMTSKCLIAQTMTIFK